jgi:predicted DNA-binding transcriptional regulator AlpA
MPDDKSFIMLDAIKAAKHCSISRSHLYSLMAQGRFPKPRRLGRCVRWAEQQLTDWLLGNLECVDGVLRAVRPTTH